MPHVARCLITAVTVAGLGCGLGCGSRPAARATRFDVADARYERQLQFGFHGVEGKTRWTERVFGVILKPPPLDAASGASLWLRFYVPDAHIEDLGEVTLRAEIDGYLMPEQVVANGGVHEYRQPVPAKLLDTNVLPVKFTFDRAMPPARGDRRELGAVVTAVGFLRNGES